MASHWKDPKFFHATAVLAGTMVGVGIFGIPFVFAKAGFWVATLHLFVLAAVTALFNLLFAELVLRTGGIHQLPGYAGAWLGPWAKRVVMFCNVFGIYGALIAYLAVVGQFLHNILAEVVTIDPQLYAVGFAILISLFWVGRIKTIAVVEFSMVAILAIVMGVIIATGTPHMQFVNLAGWTPEFWFLPYGVLLFGLAGLTSVPIMRELLTGKEHILRPAILWAVGIISALYWVFALVVVGVSGETTSPEALSGLFEFLGAPIVLLGSLLGVLTIATSYLMLGTALFDIFNTDYKLRPSLAWLASLIPPVALYWFGLRDFISMIGIVGALAIGVESTIFIAAFLRARSSKGKREPEFIVRVPKVVLAILGAMFIAGSIYALTMY